MLMLLTKLARKNGAPCTQADYDTILPSLPEFAAYKALCMQMQADGKIIYRSSQINTANQMETVTLFKDTDAHTEFNNASERSAFAAKLESSGIYAEPERTTEEV